MNTSLFDARSGEGAFSPLAIGLLRAVIRTAGPALVICGIIQLSSAAACAEDNLPFEIPRDYRQLPETALIETTKGAFEISFFREAAPISVANFEYLGRKGIYNGLAFHRYVPDFVIQGGDPTKTGKGGPGWTLPSEITGELKHLKGTLGWAKLPDEVNPERRSNGSQFYITLSAAPGIDGFYTVFARVVRGMENVERLREGDKILAVRFPKKKESEAPKEELSDQPWH